MSFLQLDSGKIHYQIVEAQRDDDKPVVVFLHGLIMDNMSSWFFTMANPLASVAKVVLYDLRGHGMSDRPRDGYRIEDHVNDLRQLIDSISPEKPVILVGNSFGGLLAIAAAMEYPERIQGLCLVDAQIHDEAWKDDMLRSLTLKGEECDNVIAKNFENWLGRGSNKRSARLAKTAHQLVNETNLVDDLRASQNIARERLKQVRVPCHAVYGEKSEVLKIGRDLESQMPNFHMKIFEGCSHSVLWEKTEDVKSWLLHSVEKIAKETLH